MSWRQKITKLLTSIDGLSLRERLFVLAAMLLVIGGAWEALLAAPLEARETVASAKIEGTRKRIADLDEAIAAAAHGIGDGMADHRDRLRVLQEQLTAGEDSVRIFTSDLVDPAQMRFVLDDLISQQPGLRLVSATNLASRPLIEEDPDAPAHDVPKLYRHGLVLVLEGGYLDCLAYLKSMERLPWRLFWGSLLVETEEYPQTRITIELHTMSLEREWIGV
jgi:MSHA biogenesis protein MshJ